MCVETAKAKGQIFTPVKIVSMILDTVQYTGETVLTKTIMEPSFGKGAFLLEIVSRIIQEGKARQKTALEIREIIEQNVFGIEKDKDLYDKAILELNQILTEHHIPLPSWSNLLCGDTLLLYQNYIGKMNFCVGNPPYVRIRNIMNEYRNTVKNFSLTKGTTDMYVVFYEIGIQILKENSGRLAYITPNSFLRNTSQKKFRNYLVDHKLLTAIYDFKDSKIFDVDTYTCICVIDKNKNRLAKDTVECREYRMYDMIANSKIPYAYFQNQLHNAAWNFSSEEDVMFLQQNSKRQVKIKDIAIVQNGISTNKNSIYIGKVWLDKDCTKPYMGKHTDKQQLVYFNDYEIESTILHRCVKASRYEGESSNNYILFPYRNKAKAPLVKKSDGSEVVAAYTAYTEEEMQSKFPRTYAYLQEYREELESRDMDPKADWFAFARSQGLINSGYKKLVFKNVICKSSHSMDVHMVDEDIITYSGVYITIDATNFISSDGVFDDIQYDQKLEEVRKILASPDFHKYCTLVGKDVHGGYSYIFSSTFVKNYGIKEFNQ